MKLISFDVGIKNLAFCVFNISGQDFTITTWDIINLTEKENTPEKPRCNCKNKKSLECLKIAKYSKNNNYYCEKHAKECSQYIIPKNTNLKLNKMSLKKLIETSLLLNVNIENYKTKQEKINAIQKHIDEKYFEPVAIFKKTKTIDINLIEIGKSIKEKLNKIKDLENITHVIIENQISPLANRMKSIQCMLAQYFIMKNTDIHLEFVSSWHKLNQFSVTPTENICVDDEKKRRGGADLYKTHKKNAIIHCSQLLEKNISLHPWKKALDIKKKDDMADCFLQAVWYLQYNKIISNLQI